MALSQLYQNVADMAKTIQPSNSVVYMPTPIAFDTRDNEMLVLGVDGALVPNASAIIGGLVTGTRRVTPRGAAAFTLGVGPSAGELVACKVTNAESNNLNPGSPVYAGPVAGVLISESGAVRDSTNQLSEVGRVVYSNNAAGTLSPLPAGQTGYALVLVTLDGSPRSSDWRSPPSVRGTISSGSVVGVVGDRYAVTSPGGGSAPAMVLANPGGYEAHLTATLVLAGAAATTKIAFGGLSVANSLLGPGFFPSALFHFLADGTSTTEISVEWVVTYQRVAP
jgi:hypothetical protein